MKKATTPKKQLPKREHPALQIMRAATHRIREAISTEALALPDTMDPDEQAFRITTLISLEGRRPSDVLRVVGALAWSSPAFARAMAALQETAGTPRLVRTSAKLRRFKGRHERYRAQAIPFRYGWELRGLAVKELRAVFDELTKDRRDEWLLKESQQLEGWTREPQRVATIAAMEGLTESAVRTRISRRRIKTGGRRHAGTRRGARL